MRAPTARPRLTLNPFLSQIARSALGRPQSHRKPSSGLRSGHQATFGRKVPCHANSPRIPVSKRCARKRNVGARPSKQAMLTRSRATPPLPITPASRSFAKSQHALMNTASRARPLPRADLHCRVPLSDLGRTKIAKMLSLYWAEVGSTPVDDGRGSLSGVTPATPSQTSRSGSRHSAASSGRPAMLSFCHQLPFRATGAIMQAVLVTDRKCTTVIDRVAPSTSHSPADESGLEGSKLAFPARSRDQR